jgi:periplasmic glucans biosynthesis protein
VRRRDFIKASSLVSAPTLLPFIGRLESFWPAALAKEMTPFSAATVQELARELATKKFVHPRNDLPKVLQDLNYDQYRDIRFKRERAIWAHEGLPFQVELFHRGSFFKDPVEIFTVADGRAQRLTYTPDLFTFGSLVPPMSEKAVTDFSGFRLRAPLNHAEHFDEFVVFQGASYFRAIAKGQQYGLAGRGLALKTGDARGEEFPIFRTFWIERPRPEAHTVVVHALLDSDSTTGAYRFTIRPGDPTVMDVELTLYPRVDLTHVGLAPLTSMFFFGANDRVGIDDFRPAVHDSNGLAIWNGRGEWLWRPLINPETLQISAFVDDNPRGFGLLQRHRDFANFQDLEARYELRPSLWVEAIGGWGSGVVQLVEIPSWSEYHDNVVAFWRPDRPLLAHTENHFTYRLHWCRFPPAMPSTALAMKTMTGAGPEKGKRRFVIDFLGERLKALPQDATLEPILSTSAGAVEYPVIQPNSAAGGWRLSFVLVHGDETLCDLRCTLKLGDELLSEVWTYRWTR